MKRLLVLMLALGLGAPPGMAAASCCLPQAPEARLAMSADCCCPDAMMCDGAQTDADVSSAVTTPPVLQAILLPVADARVSLDVRSTLSILSAGPPGPLASFLSLPLRL